MSMFIAFDGPNGVGKSTLINKIKNRLENDHYIVKLTSEPTKTDIGKFTRQISETVKGKSLACLVAADRYYHIQTEIEPALLEGKIVLCDRYIASTLVLQQIDGVDKKFLLDINREVRKPDLYFILNAAPEILTKRLHTRGIKLTRFEKEEEKQQAESRLFKEAVKELSELGINTYEIDTSKEISTYCDYVYTIINERIHNEEIENEKTHIG